MNALPFFAPHAALQARLPIWNKRWAEVLLRLRACAVQKISATDDGLLVLSVYRPGDDRSSVVLSIKRSDAGVALTHTKPPAQNKPNSLVQMARKHLQGRTLARVYASLEPVAVVLEFNPPRPDPEADAELAHGSARKREKEENDWADALILDLDARPARLCVARKLEGVPERYGALRDAFPVGADFFESLCEWSVQTTKTKRRATFETPLLAYCMLPGTSAAGVPVAVPGAGGEAVADDAARAGVVAENRHLFTASATPGTPAPPAVPMAPASAAAPAAKEAVLVPGLKPRNASTREGGGTETIGSALALLPTHVRRAAKTRLQFFERRLLRQKQDMPPQGELDALERRAEGLRAHLYLWPKESPTWYVPREIIESHGLPAVFTLKQGEKPGDLLTRAFHEIDRLKRRAQELRVRLAESEKALDDFSTLLLAAGAEVRELRESLGLDAAVPTASRPALEARVALNLPHEARRLLAQLQVEWTEGSQRTRELEEEKVRRLPYRTYEASTGEFLRVAKSASDGDSMLRLMPSHHTWVHVMTGEGSHVWLEKPKKAKPSSQAVREAAILAVHHSKQSRAQEAEVYVATRADIDKRKDLAPGKVIVRKAGSLLVRYEDEELQRVLGTLQTFAV